MLIVAGHKRVRRYAGVAADYCPICREFRPFRVTILRNVPHLYYVPVAKGGVLAHELECANCHSLLGVQDPGFTGYSRTFVADVAELARHTNPDVVARNRLRLDRSDRLAAGQVTAAERRAMVREPFEALDYMVQRNWGRGSIPTIAALAIAAAVFLIPAALITFAAGNGSTGAAMVLTVCAVVAILIAARSLRRGPRSWTRRHIHPRLAAALIPLAPTEKELSAALDQMRQAKKIIAKWVRAEDLHADLDRIRAGRPG